MDEVLIDLYEKIMESDQLILVLALAEGCNKTKSTLLIDLEDLIMKNNVPCKLFTLCFDEDDMPWPRPLTQTLYYFVPKNTKPLFHKTGRQMITTFLQDLGTVNKMTQGSSFLEAVYSGEQKELLENTEKQLIEENNSQYPSKIKMIRTFGKEMWNTAKRAGQGLPVLATAEKVQTRFSLCEGCEHFTPEYKCVKCGCFMKAKVNLEASTCPIGKW